MFHLMRFTTPAQLVVWRFLACICCGPELVSWQTDYCAVQFVSAFAAKKVLMTLLKICNIVMLVSKGFQLAWCWCGVEPDILVLTAIFIVGQVPCCAVSWLLAWMMPVVVSTLPLLIQSPKKWYASDILTPSTQVVLPSILHHSYQLSVLFGLWK